MLFQILQRRNTRIRKRNNFLQVTQLHNDNFGAHEGFFPSACYLRVRCHAKCISNDRISDISDPGKAKIWLAKKVSWNPWIYTTFSSTKSHSTLCSFLSWHMNLNVNCLTIYLSPQLHGWFHQSREHGQVSFYLLPPVIPLNTVVCLSLSVYLSLSHTHIFSNAL